MKLKNIFLVVPFLFNAMPLFAAEIDPAAVESFVGRYEKRNDKGEIVCQTEVRCNASGTSCSIGLHNPNRLPTGTTLTGSVVEVDANDELVIKGKTENARAMAKFSASVESQGEGLYKVEVRVKKWTRAGRDSWRRAKTHPVQNSNCPGMRKLQ